MVLRSWTFRKRFILLDNDYIDLVLLTIIVFLEIDEVRERIKIENKK